MEVEDLRNTLVEAVNARNPELLEEVDLGDTESLEEIIETVSQRFPRMMMTNGDLDGLPVGVVWMPDQSDRYRVVGHVEVITEDGGPRVTLVDGVDPDLVAEAPAGRAVAEWETGADDSDGDDRWV